MGYNFYAMLSRMKYITRWALMRNTRTENISEHTNDVAILSHALAVLTNRRFNGKVNVSQCVLLAMYHDAPEILTGDMPTPVKYFNPVIRDAYRQVESVSSRKLLSMLPEDIREEYEPLFLPGNQWKEERKLVKAADKIAALIKCVEELGQGNNEFKEARRSIEESIHKLKIPAAECFLEEFLPAFELTLDEQK